MFRTKGPLCSQMWRMDVCTIETLTLVNVQRLLLQEEQKMGNENTANRWKKIKSIEIVDRMKMLDCSMTSLQMTYRVLVIFEKQVTSSPSLARSLHQGVIYFIIYIFFPSHWIVYIVQSLLGHQLIFIRSQAGFLIYLSLHTLGCMYDVSRARWDGPSIVCVCMVALGVSLKTKRIRVHFFSPPFLFIFDTCTHCTNDCTLSFLGAFLLCTIYS